MPRRNATREPEDIQEGSGKIFAGLSVPTSKRLLPRLSQRLTPMSTPVWR